MLNKIMSTHEKPRRGKTSKLFLKNFVGQEFQRVGFEDLGQILISFWSQKDL